MTGSDRNARAKALHDAIKAGVATECVMSGSPDRSDLRVMANVELSRDVHDRIEAEARDRGFSISGVVGKLTDRLPASGNHGDRPTPAFVAADASERGITNRIDELLDDGSWPI